VRDIGESRVAHGQYVSQRRYLEVMKANDGRVFQISTGAVEVGLLHAALRLALLHPRVKEMSPSFHIVAENLKQSCLELMGKMGFSEKELEYLDSDFEGKEYLIDST